MKIAQSRGRSLDRCTLAAVALATTGVALTVTLNGVPSRGTADTVSTGVEFAANATSTHCDPHIKLTAGRGAGFDIGVCIDDRGTGTTAYPDIWVNTAGTTANCSINISVWDDRGNRLSATDVGCAGGHSHYTGITTAAAGKTVHTFARLDYTGQQPISIGNSPAITLASAPGATAAGVGAALQQTRGVLLNPTHLFPHGDTPEIRTLTTDLEALPPRAMDAYLTALSPEERTRLNTVLSARYTTISRYGASLENGTPNDVRIRLANAITAKSSAATLASVVQVLTFLQPGLQTTEGPAQKATKWDWEWSQTPPTLQLRGFTPSLSDADQRDLADCYFHAELLSLAKLDPGFVKQNIATNTNGTYTVTFYPGGTPTQITITADLPYNSYTGWTYGGTNNGGWIARYEKAYAQLKGGYPAIEGLDPTSPQAWTGAAYTDLTGKTSTRIGNFAPNPLYPSNRTPDLSTIAMLQRQGKAVVTSTWPRQLVVARDLKGLLGNELDSNGRFSTPVTIVGADPRGSTNPQQGGVLDPSHEYVVENADATGITLANPWGIGGGAPFEVKVSPADYAKDFMDAAFVQP